MLADVSVAVMLVALPANQARGLACGIHMYHWASARAACVLADLLRDSCQVAIPLGDPVQHAG